MKNKYFLVIFFVSSLFTTNLFSENHFNSQASQDEFVYTVLYDILNKKDCGFYIDIGACHPIFTNNSYFFEEKMGWNGYSIDISTEHQEKWNSTRKNPLLIADALQFDYSSILQNAPYSIDYLSIDVDRDYDIILKRIPFDKHIFKVITIEHDSYLYGNIYKEKEREILTGLGYFLLCPDVSLDWNYNSCIQQCAFEDWWIHPSILTDSQLECLQTLDLKGKDHSKIIQSLQLISKEAN